VPLTGDDAHDAGADALAAARIAYVLASRYPLLHESPVEYVHQWQGVWAREQAVSLQRYLRKQDPAAVVSPEWPMIARQRVAQ